jgi:HlyD family secretion protein
VVVGQPLIPLSDPTLELDAIARETQIVGQMSSQRSLQLNFELTRTNDARAVIAAEYNILRLTREVGRRQPLASAGFTSREKLD